MDAEKTLSLTHFWPMIVVVISFIAWLIRLEAKVLYMERDNIRTAKENSKKEASMSTEIKEVNNKLTEALKTLAKIEGRLEGHTRSDS